VERRSMTQEEFNNEKERVDAYDRLFKRRTKLQNDGSDISKGILKIVAVYQNEISYINDYELKEKVVTAICSVYDDEIKQLEDEMKNI
jgi:hypothetical protein